MGAGTCMAERPQGTGTLRGWRDSDWGVQVNSEIIGKTNSKKPVGYTNTNTDDDDGNYKTLAVYT